VVTGDLFYCSAGHPPAFLLRASGEFESLSDGGLLLACLMTRNIPSGK
jgi:serine phosphatase RsbU (regulator of sigma subunit)